MELKFIFLALSCAVLICGNEGKWCIGWQRSADGKDTSSKRLACSFKLYDGDQDGEITKEEFFTSVGVKGYPKEGLPVIFAVLDANDDGVVPVKEFKVTVPKLEKLHLFQKCKRGGCVGVCWG